MKISTSSLTNKILTLEDKVNILSRRLKSNVNNAYLTSNYQPEIIDDIFNQFSEECYLLIIDLKKNVVNIEEYNKLKNELKKNIDMQIDPEVFKKEIIYKVDIFIDIVDSLVDNLVYNNLQQKISIEELNKNFSVLQEEHKNFETMKTFLENDLKRIESSNDKPITFNFIMDQLKKLNEKIDELNETVGNKDDIVNILNKKVNDNIMTAKILEEKVINLTEIVKNNKITIDAQIADLYDKNKQIENRFYHKGLLKFYHIFDCWKSRLCAEFKCESIDYKKTIRDLCRNDSTLKSELIQIYRTCNNIQHSLSESFSESLSEFTSIEILLFSYKLSCSIGQYAYLPS